MPHGSRSSSFGDEIPAEISGSNAEVYGSAAGFYVALLRNGYLEEATEFAEWFLDAFDKDLEE